MVQRVNIRASKERVLAKQPSLNCRRDDCGDHNGSGEFLIEVAYYLFEREGDGGYGSVECRRDCCRRSVPAGANARLTSREWEVLNLIAGGLSTRQVADKLTLSPTAIRVHIAAVVRKLGVESRTEAIELFTRADDELNTSLRLA